MLRYDPLGKNINILISFLYFILVLHMTCKAVSVFSEPLRSIYFLHSIPHLSLRYLYHLSVKLFQHLWQKNISGFFRATFGNSSDPYSFNRFSSFLQIYVLGLFIYGFIRYFQSGFFNGGRNFTCFLMPLVLCLSVRDYRFIY